MKVYYEQNTGEIMMVVKEKTGFTSFAKHPHIETDAQDLTNKRVDINTRTLIDKE